MSFSYATFSQALAIEMAVPNNDPTNPQFASILPTLIDQAEQRCYRDLDLLYATSAQILLLTAGSSKLDLSQAMPKLLILEDVNLVIGGTIGTKGVVATGGSGAAIVSDTAPVGAAPGNLWFSSTDAQLYLWYFDGDLSQWAPVINGFGGGGIGGTQGTLSSVVAWVGDLAPPAASIVEGSIWFSTTDVQLYARYHGQWVVVTNGSGGTGIGAVGTSDPLPMSPVVGNLFYSSSDGQMYCFFNDGTSSQWVAVVNAGTGPPGGVQPANSLIVIGGERVPVCPVSLEWLRMSYGLSSSQGAPVYYAMNDDSTIFLGPFPDKSYAMEVIGKYRPVPLYTAGTTVLSQYFPDLLLAAAMIAGAGYQQNFGAQADNPQSGLSWESHYSTLLASALGEEQRKRLHGWMSFTTEVTPMPVAQGTPGPH